MNKSDRKERVIFDRFIYIADPNEATMPIEPATFPQAKRN